MISIISFNLYCISFFLSLKLLMFDYTKGPWFIWKWGIPDNNFWEDLNFTMSNMPTPAYLNWDLQWSDVKMSCSCLCEGPKFKIQYSLPVPYVLVHAVVARWNRHWASGTPHSCKKSKDDNRNENWKKTINSFFYLPLLSPQSFFLYKFNWS